MTNREFYTKVMNNRITPEVVAFAKDSIEKLDTRNAKRSSKAKELNEPIKAEILRVLEDKDFTLGTEIAKNFAPTYTPQKIIGLLNELEKVDSVVKQERKVEKVGKRMFYKLA